MKKTKRRISATSTKIYLTLFFLISVGLAGIYYALQYRSDDSSFAHSKFRTAPSFQLPDEKEQLHRLEDFRGHLIVLHFWASWCVPCLEEISQWISLAEELKDYPFQWIAISVDQNWADAQKVWTKQIPAGQKLTPSILSVLDSTGSVSDLYGTYQFPETYLISSDLKILMKWVGPQDWKSSEIKARILEKKSLSENESS